nr:serpin A12 [Cavia porcellus]
MNLTLGLSLGLGLFLAGLLTTEGQRKPIFSSPILMTKVYPRGWKEEMNAQNVAKRNMEFGLKMLRKLAANSPRKNVFFSPLSISSAFSLLCLGAQDSTLAEIKEGFNFKGMPDRDLHQAFHRFLYQLNQEKEDIKLLFGNTMFMDRKLEPQQKFLRVARNIYNADILPVNFHDLEDTQKQINEYISQKTHGRIDNLVKNIDPGTVMLLTNYVYFRARWEHEFDPKQTKEEDFFVSRTQAVKVPMMFRAGLYDMGYDKQLFCTILEIPYQGNFTATFLLPDKGKMRHLQENLRADAFGRWKQLITKRCSPLRASCPAQGTFPAVHKAELKMDEKGTEGAAGSGVETLPMEKPENFTINRPYLMVLYETRMPSPLFLAKISNPKGK